MNIDADGEQDAEEMLLLEKYKYASVAFGALFGMVIGVGYGVLEDLLLLLKVLKRNQDQEQLKKDLNLSQSLLGLKQSLGTKISSLPSKIKSQLRVRCVK